jgi:hypothetical protein
MLDLPLLYVAVFFGVTSIILALVIIRLPVYFQVWSLIGQQLVMWIGLAEAWLRWDTPMLAQHVIADIAVIFLFAFPGMVLLDYMQRKQRISYWEKGNYPDELADKDLHINIWIAIIAILWHIAGYAERIYYFRQACARYLGNIVNRICSISWPFS